MTACQSSSPMRISSPSRVMPALLTRIVSGPISLPIASIRASTCPGTETSSTRPRPPCAASRSPIAFAPASLVAVPTTVAPWAASVSAIAAPMPRLAPVTSAISPWSCWVIACPPVVGWWGRGAHCRPNRGNAGNPGLPAASAAPCVERRVEVLRRAECARVEALVDAPGQAGEDLARAALADPGRARGGERLHATGPLHRQVELAHQGVADRLDALVDLGVHVLHHRDRRFVPGDVGHRL